MVSIQTFTSGLVTSLQSGFGTASTVLQEYSSQNSPTLPCAVLSVSGIVPLTKDADKMYSATITVRCIDHYDSDGISAVNGAVKTSADTLQDIVGTTVGGCLIAGVVPQPSTALELLDTGGDTLVATSISTTIFFEEI